MTEQETALWKQVQADYSHAVAISLKVWGDNDPKGEFAVPYEVIQAGAATCIIHMLKLRELPRGAEHTPLAPPVAVSSGGQVNLRQPSKAPAGVPPCPQCGGPLLDKRATKRTDKSPDFVCAQTNGACGKPSKDGAKWYPTGKWADKPSPVMAAAISRTLAEVPVALDDPDDGGLPF